MRFLTLGEVLTLHRRIASQSGGGEGVRDLGALESAVAQPRMTFAGRDLYPTLPEKAAALGYSLISNHPFVDGNKRTGHAALEMMLVLNGSELAASVNSTEAMILRIAAGEATRDDLITWISEHIKAR